MPTICDVVNVSGLPLVSVIVLPLEFVIVKLGVPLVTVTALTVPETVEEPLVVLLPVLTVTVFPMSCADCKTAKFDWNAANDD
jgi:hypothetical protein